MSKLLGHLPPIKQGVCDPSPHRRPPLTPQTKWSKQELRKDRLFLRKLFLRTTEFKITSRKAVGGPAELLRMIFSYGHIRYQPQVLPVGVDWKSLLTKTPHGNLPVLWVDHTAYGEPNAIVRHLSTHLALLGRSESERMVVEAILAQVESVRDSEYIQKAFEEILEQKYDDNWEKLNEEAIPTNFTFWEEQIDKTPGPYLTESGISVADMAIFDFLYQHMDALSLMNELEKYPCLHKMYKILPSHPRLREYFEGLRLHGLKVN